MSISMSGASVPILTQMLTSLSAIIDKAAAHCEARKIDPAILLNYRLAPDMFPLVRQVQIATDMAKGGIAQLAGAEPTAMPDTETSFAELQTRLARTLEIVNSFGAERIDGSEERPISIKTGQGDLHFTGEQYLVHFVLPNVLFHATTAYAILRHAGVALGKRDFLGKI